MLSSSCTLSKTLWSSRRSSSERLSSRTACMNSPRRQAAPSAAPWGWGPPTMCTIIPSTWIDSNFVTNLANLNPWLLSFCMSAFGTRFPSVARLIDPDTSVARLSSTTSSTAARRSCTCSSVGSAVVLDPSEALRWVRSPPSHGRGARGLDSKWWAGGSARGCGAAGGPAVQAQGPVGAGFWCWNCGGWANWAGSWCCAVGAQTGSCWV
mmetsp:Transcript_10617/g.23423  ORF Transcript_10617/g.23423 Transcript_10617/m.23423 type:complete len:209 (-) Transcript_10617:738-1364(-)